MASEGVSGNDQETYKEETMKVTTHREIAGRHYELAFYDGFTGPELDTQRWHPYYLPQWSSKEAARARYR